MTAMTVVDAVGFAWARWDEQPTSPARIIALQDCIDAWADETGHTALDLTGRMQAARRAGLDPARAAAHVEANL
jgi:hypothetical protein